MNDGSMIRRLDDLREIIKRGGLDPDEWKVANEIIESAMDIIYDYDGLRKTYKKIYEKYETEDPAIHYTDGSWHCPACYKRVHPMAHFCNWCGKRLRRTRANFKEEKHEF